MTLSVYIGDRILSNGFVTLVHNFRGSEKVSPPIALDQNGEAVIQLGNMQNYTAPSTDRFFWIFVNGVNSSQRVTSYGENETLTLTVDAPAPSTQSGGSDLLSQFLVALPGLAIAIAALPLNVYQQLQLRRINGPILITFPAASATAVRVEGASQFYFDIVARNVGLQRAVRVELEVKDPQGRSVAKKSTPIVDEGKELRLTIPYNPLQQQIWDVSATYKSPSGKTWNITEKIAYP